MNRLAEKALRVKSEWMVHQAKFLCGVQKKMRKAPSAAPQHKCWFRTANFLLMLLSSASFVPLPLKVHVAIDSPPSPNLGGRPI